MKKKKNLFTEKEIKILKMIAEGCTSPVICKELKYTVGTIDGYIKNMLLKTNTINRAHLVYECIKKGLLK